MVLLIAFAAAWTIHAQYSELTTLSELLKQE